MAPPARFVAPNAFSWLVLGIFVYIFISPPGDLDFCWQVRTGERILDSGQIKLPDSFSYTIHGRDLPDHEWLYEVLLALIYRGFGDGGMKVLRIIFFAAPLGILAWQLRSRDVRTHVITLAVIVGALVTFYFERLRPMVCSTIGLQLVAGWLHDHCRGKKRLDWRLPVTMLLWGNLHPAVIMGQGLLAGAIAWEWLAYYRHRPAADITIPRGLTLWGGLGLLATLIAPDPVGRLMYPFAPELRHEAQRLFQEIAPPWHYLGKAPHTIDCVFLLSIFFGVVLVLRRRELRGWEWALLVGVTALFLAATRGTVDWLMNTTALAVPQIGPLFRDWASPRRRFGRFLLKADRTVKKVFQGSFLRPQAGWPIVWIGLLTLVALLPIQRLPGRDGKNWPVGVGNFIAGGGMPTPGPWNVFSNSNDGSYLLWRFPGVARVHTDTRGFYYPGDYLMDSFFIPEASDNWRERFQRVVDQGACYVLLRKDNLIWPILEPHIQHPLYHDATHVLLTVEQVQTAAKSLEKS